MMRKVRYSVDYTEAATARRARLSVSRFEDGVIGYGVMKPVVFQQFLDTEERDGTVAAMTDMWSDGETRALLQALLDCAWRVGLRPRTEPNMAPDFAFAEVSPAISEHAELLRGGPKMATAAT
jgi:hypothetical protein